MSKKTTKFDLPCKLSYPEEACEKTKFTGDYEILTTNRGVSEVIFHSIIKSEMEPSREILPYSRAMTTLRIIQENKFVEENVHINCGVMEDFNDFQVE